MSKQKLNRGEVKLDDGLDFSGEDFNFDFGDPDVDKKRSVASPVRDGAKEAARSHFTSERNIGRYIGAALPKEYAEVFETTTTVRDEAQGALADIKKVAQKPVNDFARLLDEKIGDKHKRTKRALAWLIDHSEEYKPPKFDQRKADEDTINIAMGELTNSLTQTLAKQTQAQEESREEDQSRRDLELANQAVTDARQLKLLNLIARSNDILSKTEMGFNMAERKKSLELRYRMVFGIRDLVAGQREQTSLLGAYLKNIQHNTGLPEAQKIKLDERFHNTVKNKFVDKALGQFGARGFLGNAFKNFRERARETAEDVSDALGMAHSGIEMATGDDLDFDDESTPEQKARKKRSKLATSIALDMFGPKAAGKASEALRKRLPNLERRIQRGANQAGYIHGNLDSIASDFANGGDASESGSKQFLREMAGMFLPSRDKDNKVSMATGDALFEAGAGGGNSATTRALVEVIPGLLARLLQEQQIQRTGDMKTPLAHFDYKSGVFRTTKSMKDLIGGSIAKNTTSDMVLDSLVRTLESSGAQLSDRDKTTLKKTLMSSRMSGGTITPDRLMRPDFFKGVKDEDTRNRLSGAFRTHFSSQDGKYQDTDENLQKRYQLITTINTAVRNANDPRAVIQQAVSEGHVDVLREMGWINEDGRINLERAYGYGIGEDEAAQDNSVWRPAEGRSRRQRKTQRIMGGFRGESAPMPEPAPAPRTEPAPRPNDCVSTPLLEAMIAGQKTQSEWLEKIEANTAKPHYVPVGGGEGAQGDAPEPGFFDRSVRSHASRLKNRIKSGASGLGKWMKSRSPLVDSVREGLASSWAFGARKFQNLKDNLPHLADLYVYGSDKVRITKAMFESQTLMDAKGRIISSIQDLAESIGEIKDQAGNVILTESEKLASYLRADGVTFTKVWIDRVKRGAKGAWSGTAGLRQGIRSTVRNAFRSTGLVGRTAFKLGMELIESAQDVYVKGETEPRLLGYLMRRDAYFDQSTNDIITRPSLIKGPVVDENGQILLSAEDLKKGIVNAEGKPFRSITERLAGFLKNNMARGRQTLRKGADMLRKGFKAVGKAVSGVGKAVGKFLSFGMSGFKSDGGAAAAEEAAQSPEAAASYTVTLLTQIRDILAERLPEPPKKGMSFSSVFSSTFGGSTASVSSASGPGATPPQGPDTTVENGSGGLSGLVSGAVNTAKGVASGIGGLLSRGKGKLGKLGAFLKGSTGGDSGEASPEVMEKLKEIKDQQESEGKKSRMRAAADKIAALRERARQGRAPRREKEVRENSMEDKLRNQVNKNDASKARGGTREVQKFDTENAVDFVMNKISQAKGLIGSLLGGAAELLGMGGDGKGKAGKAGKLGRAARVGAAAGATLGGRLVGGAAKGALGLARWGLTRALPFIAMRAIPALVGGVAAALGSPAIAGAAAAVGVGLTAKWLWDKFNGNQKKAELTDSKSMISVRMAEYGFGLNDTMQYARILQLEKLLEPAIVASGDKIELDKSKVPAQELLSVFGITEDEPTRVKALLGWLENRFRPTYLKWQQIAKATNKKLEKFEDLDKATKKKVLETVEMTNTGWDFIDNPFSSEGSLSTKTSDVKAIIKAAKTLIDREVQKDQPDAKKLAEDAAKHGVTGAALKATFESIDQQVGGDGSKAAERFRNKTIPALQALTKNNPDAKALVNSAFKTGGLEALPGQRVDALSSVKLRAYGVAEPTMGTVMAISALEKAVNKFVSVDKTGASSSTLDVEAIHDEAGKYFGVAKSNVAAYAKWREWLMHRFMPVFTSYRANLQFHTGIKDTATAHQSLNAVQTAAIAHQLVAVPDIWNKELSGWPGTPGLDDARSCDQFIDYLDAASKKAVLQEVQAKPAPSSSEAQSKGYAPQRYDGLPKEEPSKNPYLQKATFKPPAPPDSEAEPRSGGGGDAGGSAKPSASVGSLPNAVGDLASGNAADQFIRLRKGAKLDGMNPELLKLFRGMAEEYGNLTGKQIAVNSGARDANEQMALYKADPSKAAKPGGSLHEKGLALDIDTATANELERMGLMRKYGFTRPVGGETWHIEPAGIQTDISGAKNDPNKATQSVLAGVGMGGGGVGMTKTSYPLGRRSTDVAVASMNASDNDVKVPSGDNATSGAGGIATGAPTSTGKAGGLMLPGSGSGGGGYASSVQSVKDNQTPATSSGSGLGQGAYAAMPAGGSVPENKELVKAAAQAVGVDPNVAMTTVAVESSFKAGAAAGTSSAKGLNQFTGGTWSDMMRKHGRDLGIPPDAGPHDLKANALLGAQFLKTNLQAVEKRGGNPDVLQAYLTHFLGQGGANTFNKLSDGDIPAKAMSDAANANKPVFYNKDGTPRTKAEILSFLSNKLTTAAKSFGIDLGGAAPSAGSSVPSTGSSDSGTGPAPTRAAAMAVSTPNKPAPDYSGSYRPGSQQLGTQAVMRDTNPSKQEQTFDTMAKSIIESKDIQVRQLTALEAILKAVNTIASALPEKDGQAKAEAPAPAVEAPAPRPAPGSNVRQVAKPLLT